MSNKESGCPVKGEDGIDACPVKGGGCGVEEIDASPSMFSNTYSMLFGKNKTETKETKAIVEEKGYNPRANDMKFGNEVQDGQRIALSKKRVISTIPKVTIANYLQNNQITKFCISLTSHHPINPTTLNVGCIPLNNSIIMQ
jgi:hypothetical protein